MKEAILDLFRDHPQFALLLSLGCSLLVAVLGVVPSFFITAANILFFGFWNGLALSFLGEALGAVLAFALYRKGFKQSAGGALHRYPRAAQLLEAKGRRAFTLIFSLRLLPFVPSGLVTFAAAIGRVTLPVFALASSLGKAPALFIEAYSVYQVTQFQWQGKVILLVCGLGLVYLAVRKRR